jgi:hypothetical protein
LEPNRQSRRGLLDLASVFKCKLSRTGRSTPETTGFSLVLLLACFLAAAFASQRLLDSFSLAGLQVKRVTLDFLDDVLGLYLTLEPPKRIFKGFTLLKSNFRQRNLRPLPVQLDWIVMTSLAHLSQVECAGIFTSPQKFIRMENCICRGANELVGFIRLAGC